MLTRALRKVQRLLAGQPGPGGPQVSFVLIVYDMPRQAENTVRSLLPDYQIGVRPEEYEVLIVENASRNPMRSEFTGSLPANFRYFLRQETQPTPIHAINFGIREARGANVCVMIDGARMLSPGVVKNTLLGHRLYPRAAVTVPGYHLGHELQQKAVFNGYDEQREQELMQSIAWPNDGYRLFDIACWSGSSSVGFYNPHGESNCLSLPKDVWRELGGYDERFDMRGGGFVNLDMYKRALELPGIAHVMLHGEGTFHQFHGGVTTGGEEAAARQEYLNACMAQYQTIRGHRHSNPHSNPIFLGELADNVISFIQLSAAKRLERSSNPAKQPAAPVRSVH